MITRAEIKKKALRMYKEVLASGAVGEPYFPRTLPSNKKLSKDFSEMSKEIRNVMADAKSQKGFGYTVLTRQVRTRHHHIQDIPTTIIFESLTDYLRFTGKNEEYYAFLDNCWRIKEAFPALEQWIIAHPLLVIEHMDQWPDLLKVCQWFVHNFRPNNYYIRELPITVHTKFIESHKKVLQRLLETLIPEKLDEKEQKFEKRFRLKYAQPTIRLRSLDSQMLLGSRYDDISLPLEQLIKHPLDFNSIFIVENLMNFLTFPKVGEGMAIWGKGFALELFKHVTWLSDKSVYYWSDIDAQGFQMLSQLRSYFPHVQSILMSRNVFEKHSIFQVKGTPTKMRELCCLTNEENLLFQYVLANDIRLEQERISQSYVNSFISNLFLD